nr:hypothetical protein CFP56_40104 [Quercus suber]
MVDHLFDTPEPEEVRRIVGETIPQIHLASMLCEVELGLSLTARRMLENQPIATAFMGNRHALKILPSVSTNFGVQSPHHRQREGDRGAVALANDDAGVGADNRVDEEDWMEFDGGSETAFTLQ